MNKGLKKYHNRKTNILQWFPLPKNVNFEINHLHIVQNTDISKQERNFANIGLGRLLTIVLVKSAHNKIDFVRGIITLTFQTFQINWFLLLELSLNLLYSILANVFRRMQISAFYFHIIVPLYSSWLIKYGLLISI